MTCLFYLQVITSSHSFRRVGPLAAQICTTAQDFLSAVDSDQVQIDLVPVLKSIDWILALNQHLNWPRAQNQDAINKALYRVYLHQRELSPHVSCGSGSIESVWEAHQTYNQCDIDFKLKCVYP